jgi:hypothetical protein
MLRRHGATLETALDSQAFDLNDITREPSDEQLDALMEAVAVEARRQSQAAHEQLMQRLRAEIAAIKLPKREPE